MDRYDSHSPIGRSSSSVGSRRHGSMYTTPALEQITLIIKDEDTAAFVSTARQDAKRQEYETSILNYNRAIQNLVKRCNTTSIPSQLDVLIILARAQLEAGCVALQAKSLEYAETTLKDATRGYLRCSDMVDQETTVNREFVEAVKSWASASATRSQTVQFPDKRVYTEATRRALHLYDWALRLVDPSGSEVSTVVLGSLSSLGQLAAQLQCFDWALELFERNQSIKEMLGIETESVRKHIDRVTDKIAQHQNSREAMRAARFREETERLLLDEFRNRMDLTFIVNKTLMRLVRSIPPPPSRPRLRSRPSSGDSTIHNFFKTGNFTGLSPQQELEAFRTDVEEGKSLVKTKQLEDAQDHFTVAVDLAAQSFSIPLEEYRSALGNLAYVYCMRAQTENERGSKEYRKMMMRSVPYYKKIVEMTEERMALNQSNLQEEVSLASTYLQLGVVSVSLDRQETGLYYMRKAKSIREKFRMDTAQEDRHIQAVEKGVRKRDAELVAHAAQVAEARKQTIGLNERPTFQQCVSWYNHAKVLMQQRQCEDAEPLLLQALLGFEAVMGSDPHIRKRPEYRLTLTGLGATYYFLGQEHSRKTTGFAVNNEQALVYYHQALQAISSDAAPDGSDDVQIASLLFHLACCYANMRRYDVASIHFSKSRDIKLRVGLTVEDIEVNLDALNQRLVSLIDEDVIRQQAHIQRSGGPSSAPSGGSLSSNSLLNLVTPSANSSTTSTPRDMSLNGSTADSPKSIGRRSRAVSFLLPSQSGEIDSMESSIAEFPSSPVTRSESPKLHLTGSILVEGGSFGSPKGLWPGGRDENFSPTELQPLSLPEAATRRSSGATSSVVDDTSGASQHQEKQNAMNATALLAFRMAKLEEIAKDIAADLWVPANRAIAFIVQEERRDRLDLFSTLDTIRRAMITLEYRELLWPQLARFTLRKEEISRSRVVIEYQKQWLVLAQQRIIGSEQFARNRIVLDHRRVVSLPQSDNSYAIAFNQEALARFRMLFEQRVNYFMTIEQHHRERQIIAETLVRRQHLVFPKLVDAAVVSKGVMFKGAIKFVLSQWRTWIFEGETIDRFALIHQEQKMTKLIRLTRAAEMASIDEAAARLQWVRKEELTRMQNLAESFYRALLDLQQRQAARVMLRYPMLQGELLARETLARRETLAKPEALLFLSGILQPVLDMHQRHLRRMLERDCQRTVVQTCALPIASLNERNGRIKLIQLHQIQHHLMLNQALTKLEETHRSDIARAWESHLLHSIAVRFLEQQEALHRALYLEKEFSRVYVGITDFERMKMRESLEDGEISRRRVLRMLHEEGLLGLFEKLEESIRKALEREQQRAQHTVRIQQERAHLTLRELLLRRVGERLAMDHLIKNVLTSMAPHALQAMFLQVSSRKLFTVESSFRSMLGGIASRSVGHLQRQGLQVLASATLLDVVRQEAVHALKTIHVPFLSGVEQLARLDLSYRHREILNLMYLDHRRGMLTVTAATESRCRRTKALEEQITFEEMFQSEEQLRIQSKEREGRRITAALWSASLQPTVLFPMQREKLVMQERISRRTVGATERVAFFVELKQTSLLSHQQVLFDEAMQASYLCNEGSCRRLLEQTEERCFHEASSALSQLHARGQFEVQEAHQRSLLMEYYLSSSAELRIVFADAKDIAAGQAIIREASETCIEISNEEAACRLCDVEEEVARQLLTVAVHNAEANFMLLAASTAMCADEEAQERLAIVSAGYEHWTSTVTHPALLALYHLHLEDAGGRLGIYQAQEAEFEALKGRMMHSGMLVSLQLREIVTRHDMREDAFTKLAVLQHVAFDEERTLFSEQLEGRRRRLIEHACTLMWLDMDGSALLDTIRITEAAAWASLQVQCESQRCLLEQVQDATTLAESEAADWGLMCCRFGVEAANVHFAEAGEEVITTSESEAREEIARWERMCIQSDLAPMQFELQLLTQEMIARQFIFDDENTFAVLMETEVHMSGARLQQRAVEASESATRTLLMLDEVEATEMMDRIRIDEFAAARDFSEVLFGAAWERLQRQHNHVLEHHERNAISVEAWLRIHETMGNQLLPLEQISLQEELDRSMLVVAEEREVAQHQSQWEATGSTLMILQREHTARRELEHHQYQLDVVHPLQLKFCDVILRNASSQSEVEWFEHASRISLHEEMLIAEHEVICDEDERMVAQHMGIFTEQAQSLMDVLRGEGQQRDEVVRSFQQSMCAYVAALVLQESHMRIAHVIAWEYSETCQQHSEHLFYLLLCEQSAATVSVLEPSSRAVLCAQVEADDRAKILIAALEEEEAVTRQETFGSWVELHHLQLMELAWRASVMEEQYDALFRIRFGPILAQVTVGRTDLELQLLDSRAHIEKEIFFDNFFAVQRLVVMSEFTMRLETIERIQCHVLLEKKEWHRVIAQFREEGEVVMMMKHHSGDSAVISSGLFGRRASSGAGGFDGGSGLRSLGRRGIGSSSSSLFGPRSATGGFVPRGLPKLPPLNPEDTKGPSVDRTSGFGVSPRDDGPGKRLNRPKVAAITSAEDSIIREALNIRPMSASHNPLSAAGTPREGVIASPASRTRGRIVLKPLPSAMISFKRSDRDEAAIIQFVDKIREEMERTATMESFQRYVLEEQHRKSRVHLASILLLERFAVCGDDCMLEALEAISIGLFENVMSGGFGLAI